MTLNCLNLKTELEKKRKKNRMPVINITQEMMDHSKEPEAGWSLAILNAINEAPAASGGNSVNFFFEFKLLNGPGKEETNRGRFKTTFFNNKALGLVPGSKGVPDVKDKLINMVASLQGIRKSELSPDQYDLDKLVGKECFIKIEASVDGTGKLISVVTDFSSTNDDVPF